MQELLIATRNPGKVREIKELLSDFNFKITSLLDYPDMPIIDEDGKTFAENAIKKAATIALYTKKLTMGEDSGLEVKALGNKPGIHSARFSGEGATDEKNNLKLLESLKSVPAAKRQARYRCFIAIADGKNLIGVVSGSCQGVIAQEEAGTNGFGYDSLFMIPAYGKTFGQLDPSIKAKMSHRAKALKRFRTLMESYLKKQAKKTININLIKTDSDLIKSMKVTNRPGKKKRKRFEI